MQFANFNKTKKRDAHTKGLLFLLRKQKQYYY